jgi:hypothetical protein
LSLSDVDTQHWRDELVCLIVIGHSLHLLSLLRCLDYNTISI